MLLEKIVILGKLKILSKHHTSYDVLSDHLTDKGSLITSDLLSDNEQAETLSKDDLDLKYITLWISFNAAYGKEVRSSVKAGDKLGFRTFILSLANLDKEKTLSKSLWTEFSQSIKVLLDNKYTYQPYWDFYNGTSNSDIPWEESFKKSKEKSLKALVEQDSDTLLSVVFDRLYTMRNQLVHGGATCGSQVNRLQLFDGCAILQKLLPVMLDIMMDNYDKQDFGKPYYPYVKE